MNELNELVEHAIEGIKDRGEGTEASELHHILFNEDYYIIGYYQAEEWLKDNVGIFAAIEEIKTYEQDNFGEVSTDLSSSEKVVNMYVYIKGEEILQESETLTNSWNTKLDEEDINNIIEELEELL